MANRDPLLTYEEFYKNGGKASNNFYLHFFGEKGEYEAFDCYRERLPYVTCYVLHRSEFEHIARKLESMTPKDNPKDRTFLQNVRYQRLLYRAYVLMHPCAESNYELFA